MTVKELRTLVDNLEEYIHVPEGIERLKKTILHLAVSGQLVPQNPSEGTGEELYQQIQTEKQKLILEGKLKKQKPLPEITEDEIPFEIPKSWKWVRLGDVSRNINYGYTDSASKEKVGPKFVRITDIQDGHINWESVPYCKIDEKNKTKYLLENGDILFARTGGTVGKSYLCTNPPESVFASYLIRVQPSNGFVSNFLLHYFDTPFYWASIYGDMSGTGQPNFNGTKLSNLIIPIPSNKEQKRIVLKVNEYFELIDELAENYKAEQEERAKLVKASLNKLAKEKDHLALDMLSDIIKTKEDVAELRKTILHLAVSGQLVPQDPSEGTGEELYQQIQAEKQKLIAEGKLKKQKPLPEITEDEVPFEIPKTWMWAKLGDLTNYGSSEKIESVDVGPETWILELEDIEKESSKLLQKIRFKDRASKSSKNVFFQGDVLYGKLRPYLDKVIVADEDGVSTTEALPLRTPGGLLNSHYLRLFLKSPSFIKLVNDLTYGVKMPRLGTEDGKNALICLPPKAEQIRIIKKTTQLLDLITKLEPHLERKL